MQNLKESIKIVMNTNEAHCVLKINRIAHLCNLSIGCFCEDLKKKNALKVQEIPLKNIQDEFIASFAQPLVNDISRAFVRRIS